MEIRKPSDDLRRRIPVDVVVHPRNLNFILVAYGGTVLGMVYRSSLADIYFSIGGIVFFDLVTQLSSPSVRILMKDFHRKNRRRYVHMSFSYLQELQEVLAILTL